MMEHETYGRDAAWTVADEDGKLIVDNVQEGFNEAVLQQIRDYLNPPQTMIGSEKKLRQKQAEIALRSGKPAPQMAVSEDMERRRK